MSGVLIIGGGPAGVSAALYTARAGIKTVIIENGPAALAKANLIENYYGASASGPELYSSGLLQAAAAGAQIVSGEVIDAEYDGSFSAVLKGTDSRPKADVLILATGSKNNSLSLPGLKEFEGRGISYCAVCDGFFFRKKRVAVLGSGAYALHEAGYLKQLAASVTVLTNGEDAKAVQQAGFDAVTLPLAAVQGENRLEAVTFADGSRLETDGLFIALGTADSTDLARKLGAEINGRYIAAKSGGTTNIPGLLAAGDCTGGIRQVAKAVCDGMYAGMTAVKYLRKKK